MASTTGDVVKTGKMFAAQSHSNMRQGAGVKNLGPNASKRPNESTHIKAIAGRTIKGPDLGGGTS